MNLKAHLPIIALCGLTFAVSFAAGLWWDISQQNEWQASESTGQDVKQSIAKRQTDKEKTKSDKEGQTDTEQEKAPDGEKDKPEKTTEDSDTLPAEVTPESGAVPNVSPAAVPSNAKHLSSGVKMKAMSEEQRAKKMEAIQRALETAARIEEIDSTVEISSEEPSDGEVIFVEPDI